MSDLGYEQLRALRIMRDTPDREAANIANEADCSWDELFELSYQKLAGMGLGRLRIAISNPVITIKGLAVLKKFEDEEGVGDED